MSLDKCSQKKRLDGKPYPRTCELCGIGQCKWQTTIDNLESHQMVPQVPIEEALQQEFTRADTANVELARHLLRTGRNSLEQNVSVDGLNFRIHVSQVNRSPDLPQPENQTQRLQRKYMLFVLTQLIEVMAMFQRACVDIISYGPEAEFEKSGESYLEILGRCFEHLEALVTLSKEHGFDLQKLKQDDQIGFMREHYLQRYQRASGRGLLRLPAFIVKETTGLPTPGK